MNRVNYPALTGVRALAAFMVYIHHYNPFSVTVFGQYCHDFFSEFHIGVTLFFVLSGFLICNRYYDEENFSFKIYFIKRFARIYPMYFLLTTFTFLFFVIFHSQTNLIDLKNYFFNISFLKGFFDDLKFTGIAQGWSLTVEEVFYLLAPIFFVLLKRSKLFLMLLPIFFIGIGLLLVSIFNGIDCYGFMNPINFMLDFTFLGRVTEFFVGIALALFLRNNSFDLKSKIVTYIGFFGIIVSICALVFLKVGTGFGVDTLTGKVINTLLLPVFGIAPLFLGLIKEKTIFSKLFSTKIFLLLGKSSYIFYLIHLGIFVTILNKISTNQWFIFIALNVISVVLYRYLESPLNKIIRKNAEK
jgi:peptidoglycan/LPS O-acetylase OafA/YrhL